MLRKTFISRLVNSGLKVTDLTAIARHLNIKTTLEAYREIELDRMGEEIPVLQIGEKFWIHQIRRF